MLLLFPTLAAYTKGVAFLYIFLYLPRDAFAYCATMRQVGVSVKGKKKTKNANLYLAQANFKQQVQRRYYS